MIVILEGVNGVGKTTYAKLLSTHLGIPRYRAFKANLEVHWGDNHPMELLLKDKFKVPLNTHVEDLFSADLLGRIGGDVVLDRSLPSAIAYGLLENDPLLPTDTLELFHYWMSLLRDRKVLYVWMTAQYAVARSRSESREQPWWPLNMKTFAELESIFRVLHDQWEMDKLVIDTGETSIGDGVEQICQRL